MKTISKILLMAGITGLATAVALADGMQPTAKENAASVILIGISVANLIIMAYINEFLSNNK